MSPLAEALRRLANALLRIQSEPPPRPDVVDDALSRDYGDVEEWKQRGGGAAPPDAPHIDDDGQI